VGLFLIARARFLYEIMLPMNKLRKRFNLDLAFFARKLSIYNTCLVTFLLISNLHLIDGTLKYRHDVEQALQQQKSMRNFYLLEQKNLQVWQKKSGESRLMTIFNSREYPQ
jgi:hypothetical protein